MTLGEKRKNVKEDRKDYEGFLKKWNTWFYVFPTWVVFSLS